MSPITYAESVVDIHEHAGVVEVARLLLQLRDGWRVSANSDSSTGFDHAQFIKDRDALWGTVSKRFLGSTGSMVVGILSTIERVVSAKQRLASEHLLTFNAIRGWDQRRLSASLQVAHDHDKAVAALSMLLTRERGFNRVALPERLEAGDLLVKLLVRDPQLRVVTPGLEYYTTRRSDEVVPYCWDIIAAMERMLVSIVTT